MNNLPKRDRDVPMRAAQYVRMSTDMQTYSIQNQIDAINTFALARGMMIVRTYADEGRSGLSVRHRSGLQALIEDVEQGRVDFDALLVFDVSRWGRFQDADESAYYEYLCRRAGIEVIYCAEPFQNDGSAISAIVKALKRAMAAEYSRELSQKTLAGQCRLVRLGYRQGSVAGYGLRRMLIGPSGMEKGELAFGDRKNLQTDRVVLVPGPAHEVAAVIEIFEAFARGENEKAIADSLNARSIKNERGQPWQRCNVSYILCNPKYVGHNVFRRSEGLLHAKRKFTAPEQWVRADNAFPALVPQALFDRVQERIRCRNIPPTDEEMLTQLRRMLDAKGHTTENMMRAEPGMACPSSYRKRFGSTARAYALIGHRDERDHRADPVINRALRRLRPKIAREIVRAIGERGGEATIDPITGVILIGEGFRLTVLTGRIWRSANGKPAWHYRVLDALRADLFLVVRAHPKGKTARDFFLYEPSDLKRDAFYILRDQDTVFQKPFKVASLGGVYDRLQRFTQLGGGTA